MNKTIKNQLKIKFNEALRAKERYRWYRDIKYLVAQWRTVVDACKEVRVPRSEYYYWDRKIREIILCNKPWATIRSKMFISLSKKPKYSPKQIPKDIEDKIIRIRKKTNQWSEYIQYHMKTTYMITLSITWIYKVLKRNWLINERKYHKKKKPVIINRNYKPWEKLQVDTKYVKNANWRTYYQFWAIDMATWIVYKRLYDSISPSNACKFLRRAIVYFPFPIENIQTDNWIEYTWRLTPEIKKEHPFTTQCKLMSMEHVLIPPASPTYNSRIERTHRSDKEELWNKRRFYSFESMQKALIKYNRYYNYKRPTPSKKWRTPIEYANEEFGLNIWRLINLVQDVWN